MAAIEDERKTFDSLVVVYDSLNRNISDNDFSDRRESDLIYVLMHHKLNHGSEFSDWRVRINELKRNIADKRASSADIKNWMDSVSGTTNRNKRQSADIIQVTEDYETYKKEITVIHYTDSARVISRLLVCDTMGANCRLVNVEGKKISNAQWRNLEQKIYVAHFWEMQLKEMGMIGDASVWTIKACIINSNGEPTNYHEIELIGPSGSLYEIGNYMEQLLPQKLLPDYEIPHRRHHNC